MVIIEILRGNKFCFGKAAAARQKYFSSPPSCIQTCIPLVTHRHPSNIATAVLTEPHTGIFKDVFSFRGSLTQPSLWSLQMQMLRKSGKRDVCTTEGESKWPTHKETEARSGDWQPGLFLS